MFKPCPSRGFYGIQFFIVLGLLAFAYFLEWYRGLVPCALCEVQRIVFASLGFLYLVGTIFQLRRKGQILINLLLFLLALLGILFAARQVWLQYFPPLEAGGACDASLYYLLRVMSLSEVLATVLVGGPQCAAVSWQFLDLSIAEWSLLWFLGFLFLSLGQCLAWVFSKKR